LLNPNHNLFITSKNISEFFAVTSKQKIDSKTSWNSYHEIKTVSKIMFPIEESLSIFEKLIQQYQPKGNQVFDIEIVSIMLDNGIDQIATFNKKDFDKISEIQILEIS
jgi:predicted nucleic acid-binding protein